MNHIHKAAALATAMVLGALGLTVASATVAPVEYISSAAAATSYDLDCDGWSVNLSGYDPADELYIEVDGIEVHRGPFGGAYSNSGTFTPNTVDRTMTIIVDTVSGIDEIDETLNATCAPVTYLVDVVVTIAPATCSVGEVASLTTLTHATLLSSSGLTGPSTYSFEIKADADAQRTLTDPLGETFTITGTLSGPLTGAACAGPPAPPAPPAASGGDELAQTGPSDVSPWTVFVGLALLVVGALALVIAKRKDSALGATE